MSQNAVDVKNCKQFFFASEGIYDKKSIRDLFYC